MKKFLLCLAAVAILTGCAGRKSEQAEQARQDSLQRALDSMAREEALREAAEQARLAEEARLDSIRQDSIAQEEKMRLKVSYFPNADYDEKALKRLGFKKIKEKTTYDDEFDEIGLLEINFTRTFNGRRIDVNYTGESCHGVDIIFYDKGDKDRFMEELKKAGYKKTEYGSFFIEKYGGINFRIEGNKIQMDGCG